MTLFRSDGVVLETIRFDSNAARSSYLPFEFLGGDRFLIISPASPPLRQMGAGPADFEQAEYQPPVTQVAAQPNGGSHWLVRDIAETGVTQILVLDSALLPLGTIDLPPGVVRLSGPVTTDHVWLLERDELDIPYLVRYRIIRP